jgi:hypothetical protein
MSKTFDKLNKTFNIPVDNEETEIVHVEGGDIVEPTNEQDDLNFARSQLINLITKSNEALNNIMELASESASPRAYEVVGQILKHSSEISEKLVQLHKNKNNDNEINNNIKGNVTNNAIFLGSTNELLKALKSQNIIEDNR